MIEEPYRWVEAIQNRREYIENQLAAGSPIVALSGADGILLVTVSRERQKLFEIYDRIAMGAIGHPGDIERLRMTGIEVAGAEGFTRSAQDVSLRRLVSYSMSPLLKNAFEQIYGPPYLARMLFAELGRNGEPDLLLTLDYDGSYHTNGGALSNAPEPFAVISGKHHSASMMSEFLRKTKISGLSQDERLNVGLDAWTVGHLTLTREEDGVPSAETISAHREEQLKQGAVEAVLLDRHAPSKITYRSLKI
jgi:proteasome alpha subunit